LLIISNGHGEDLISLEIIKRLLDLDVFEKIEVLPLVGNGYIFDKYKNKKFRKVGHLNILPSGGFSNQSLISFWLDLKAGMFIDLFRNWMLIQKRAREGFNFVAVGDLLPLYFAWSSKSKFGFIGTPKSDHTWMSGPGYALSDIYHLLKGSEWDPWEMQLMKSSRCKFVIVRDLITSKNLNKKNIDARYFGNPMMDFVNDELKEIKNLDDYQKIIMLIGSRFPEAFRNFNTFLDCLQKTNFAKKSLILVPLTDNANINLINFYLIKNNFEKDTNHKFLIGEDSIWFNKNIIILLGKNNFKIWANLADVGLSNAGTATEQISGLGIPSLSIPSNGPQFTKAFAMRQQRLLGGSVLVCKNKKILSAKLISLLKDKEMRYRQARAGRIRMGKSGASQKIAHYIKLKLLKEYSKMD